MTTPSGSGSPEATPKVKGLVENLGDSFTRAYERSCRHGIAETIAIYWRNCLRGTPYLAERGGELDFLISSVVWIFADFVPMTATDGEAEGEKLNDRGKGHRH